MTGAGGLVVALLLLVLLLADVASSGSRREAFITLVSSENYLLGARVLGARLRAMVRDGGLRSRDLLLLTTCELDTESQTIMQAEGWRVAKVEPISNPFAGSGDTKAKRVFTKLRIWEPHQGWPTYDRLVYLDIDVFPVDAAAVDAMFDCAGSFCATPSSANEVEFGAINTGVIVLQPSKEVFAELEEARHGISGSYNRGDQGFLNVFFGEYCKRSSDLRMASASPKPCKALARSKHKVPIKWKKFGSNNRPNFNTQFADEWGPGERVNGSKYMNILTQCAPEDQLELCQRLPTPYNHNPFSSTVDPNKQPAILHHNYGTWKFKPWVWIVAPFFPCYESWQKARVAAALPLLRRERFTRAAICGCAAVALVLWASQLRLPRLRQAAILWQETPHTSWRSILPSGMAGILFVQAVAVSVVPRETSASVIWRGMMCFEMLACSCGMRCGPAKLPAPLAAVEGALLAIWVHATLWCPYECILTVDGLISAVGTPHQTIPASSALPSIWIFDSPLMFVAWVAWVLLSAIFWHRCWRWRRRLAARVLRRIGLTQAGATAGFMALMCENH